MKSKTATGPICSTWTVIFVDDAIGSGPAAFNVNGLTRFVCDDNSGSFILRGTGAYGSLAAPGPVRLRMPKSTPWCNIGTPPAV